MIELKVNHRYGPLFHHWTARFEGKHKFFKHLCNVIGNYTNVCYSLALRHQLYQCYLSLSTFSNKMEVGPGIQMIVSCYY
jgi:hypothetical protein